MAGLGSTYVFGPFVLDARTRTLRCQNVAVPLQPRTLALLEYFVRHDGRLITKAELLGTLWPGEIVSEQSLGQQIYLLRGALAAHAPGTALLVTEPGRGLRFVGNTEIRSDQPAESALTPLCLAGRYHLQRRSAANLGRAKQYFAQAIAAAPNDPAGYAGLADALVLQGEYLFSRPEAAFPAARDAARRALALDPRIAGAYGALGEVALYYERRLGEAERCYALALDADPGYTNAVIYRCWYRNVAGQLAQAAAESQRARERAPYDLDALATRGICDLFAHRFSAAADWFTTLVELEPSYQHARYYLAMAQALAGEYAAALDTLAAHADAERAQSVTALGAFAARKLGDHARADALAAELATLARGGTYVSSFNTALLGLGAGDVRRALAELARGAQRNDPWTVFALNHPLFDALRAAAGFHELELVRD